MDDVYAFRSLARQLVPRMIKGKPDPITAFAAYDVGGSAGQARGVQESTVIGRERELTVLFDGLAKARTGIGAVIVIEGDAGIGKTTLVNRTVAEATNAGMVVLAGAGDSTDQTTAYFAWRRVFLDLLEQSDLTLRTAAARSSLPGSAAEPVHGRSGKTTIRLGAFAGLAPLLEDMLGRDVVDNGDTALLRGHARADALTRLLHDLLREAAKTAPIVVVMDDIHWLDPTSLSFFADLGASRAPGEKLTWRYWNVEAGRKLDNYWTTKCTGCALKSKCTPAKERRVKRWEHEAVLDAMQERLDRAPRPCASDARPRNIHSEPSRRGWARPTSACVPLKRSERR